MRSKIVRRMFCMLIICALLGGGLPTVPKAFANEVPAASDRVVITEVTGENGFTHPGIGLTKQVLDNMRAQILAGKDPWLTYYIWMSDSGYASKTFASNLYASSNPDGTDNPRTRAVNNKGAFVADGLRAYTQALMYYVTGDEAYRANAMRIIRLWQQMDPGQYVYFADSHIHMGIPLNRMVAAAEILRYSSAEGGDPRWVWTQEDTDRFTANVIHPMTETFLHFNDKFMNQHLYPLLGAMSGYIFTENIERYEEGVEWFAVNRTAVDQGQNGSIKQLFRLVTEDALTGEPLEPPRVQHVEMGRDQAHGAGDLTNVEIIGRLLEAQGTKVDPVEGTLSNAENAVGVYEFLDNRILDAADYFARFMLGHDTPWTPVAAHTDPEGNPTIVYKDLASGYRGRIGGNVYGQYYFYTYEMGMNLEQEAPYYKEMFDKRLPFWWESPDGGADYWMFIPAEAAEEGTSTLPRVSPDPARPDIELRTTLLDGHSAIREEDGTGYVEMTATPGGSEIAIVASSTAVKTVGIKVRTNGTAKLEINGWADNALTLPDTNGEWRYVTLRMNAYQGLGDMIFAKATGTGAKVDIDHFHLEAAQQLTPPVFNEGADTVRLFAYTGAEAVLQASFAATDPDEGETLSYRMDHLPEGASIDGETGLFTWQPQQAGRFHLVASVTDGTSVTAKTVDIIVAGDRQSALEAAAAGHDPDTRYLASDQAAYERAYTAAEEALPEAADDVFYLRLAELNGAVSALRMLTPPLPDGTLNYVDTVSVSTFGTELANLADGAPDTFAGYYLAENLSYTMDFGAPFKVSAEAFGLQVRASFPERIGGVAVFGSNDKESWIRLTPGLTTVTEDMQRLEVEEGLQDTPFRFLKVHMIEPSSTMLEMSELRIYGLRHEANHKMDFVSLGSPQSVEGRVDTGDTVRLSFRSTEPVQDVQVTIQGRAASAETADGLNWTAEALMADNMPTGPVTFVLEYKTQDGLPGDPVKMTTDGTSLHYLDRSSWIDVTRLGTVTASDPQWGSGLSREQVGYLLFDGNPATFGDLAAGAGAHYVVDFGPEAAVRLTDVLLLPRATHAGRMNGLIVQGSNDQTNWTPLTPPVSGAGGGSWTLFGSGQLQDSGLYRYVRIYNAAEWYGNIAEVELYGRYELEGIESRIVGPSGYTRLSYDRYLQEVQRIRLALEQPEADPHALLAELLAAEDQLVSAASLPMEKVAVSPEMVKASTARYGNGAVSPEQNGWMAWDGDINTFTDATQAAAWIDLDLGEGKETALGAFRFHPRNSSKASEYTRVNGAVLQASHDGGTYTDIHVISGVNSVQWVTVPIRQEEAYRYWRYHSPAGYANVAELELYRKAVDTTLLDHLLEEAEALREENYEAESFAVLQAAKEAGQTAAHAETRSQEQVDAAASALREAMSGLISRSEIVSLLTAEVTTEAGVPPLLPEAVEASYSDGRVKPVDVAWEPVAAEIYAEPGSFTVTGAVYGTPLPALANVTVVEAGSPLPPGNLQASDITATSLRLSWSPAAGGAAPVAEYELMVGGETAATVTAATYSYDFTGLTPDSPYTFRVVAVDTEGGRLGSAAYTVKTAALPLPTPGPTPTPLPTPLPSSAPGPQPVVPAPSALPSPSATGAPGAGGGEQPPAAVTGSTLELKLPVQNGTAKAAISEADFGKAAAGALQAEDRTLRIMLHAGQTAASVEVELPASAWRRAQAEGVRHIAFRTDEGVAVTFEAKALSGFENGETLSFAAGRVPAEEIPRSLAADLAGRPLYEFKVRIDGEDKGLFEGKRPVEVQIPYSLQDGEWPHAVVAAFMNGAGEAEPVSHSVYDTQKGELTFYPSHFSRYAVWHNPPSFDDLDGYGWAVDSVRALAARGMAAGDGTGRFAPGNPVTRAEFVMLLTDAFELESSGALPGFKDTEAGAWYGDAVAAAREAGIAGGYGDGRFRPHDPVSRQEMAAMAVRSMAAAGLLLPERNAAAVFRDHDDIAGYAAPAVHSLQQAGYMQGRMDGLFLPHAEATRAEAAVLIARLLDIL